jgi:hypothetical protein
LSVSVRDLWGGSSDDTAGLPFPVFGRSTGSSRDVEPVRESALPRSGGGAPESFESFDPCRLIAPLPADADGGQLARNDESADGLRTDLQLVRYVLNAAE